MNHITVIAYGSPGSFARRVQEDPTLAIAVLDALRGLVAMYEVTDDCPELRRARALLKNSLAPAPAGEWYCPRCVGSGRHQRLALPPVSCSLCKGTGLMSDATAVDLNT